MGVIEKRAANHTKHGVPYACPGRRHLATLERIIRVESVFVESNTCHVFWQRHGEQTSCPGCGNRLFVGFGVGELASEILVLGGTIRARSAPRASFLARDGQAINARLVRLGRHLLRRHRENRILRDHPQGTAAGMA